MYDTPFYYLVIDLVIWCFADGTMPGHLEAGSFHMNEWITVLQKDLRAPNYYITYCTSAPQTYTQQDWSTIEGPSWPKVGRN